MLQNCADLHNEDSSIFPLGVPPVQDQSRPNGKLVDKCHRGLSPLPADTPHSSPDAQSESNILIAEYIKLQCIFKNLQGVLFIYMARRFQHRSLNAITKYVTYTKCYPEHINLFVQCMFLLYKIDRQWEPVGTLYLIAVSIRISRILIGQFGLLLSTTSPLLSLGLLFGHCLSCSFFFLLQNWGLFQLTFKFFITCVISYTIIILFKRISTIISLSSTS